MKVEFRVIPHPDPERRARFEEAVAIISHSLGGKTVGHLEDIGDNKIQLSTHYADEYLPEGDIHPHKFAWWEPDKWKIQSYHQYVFTLYFKEDGRVRALEAQSVQSK